MALRTTQSRPPASRPPTWLADRPADASQLHSWLLVAGVVAAVMIVVMLTTVRDLTWHPRTSAPRGDLEGWHQIVAEDFNTNVALGGFPSAAYPNIFPYQGLRDTSRHGLYDPQEVNSVKDGVFDYYVRTVAGQPRVSTCVIRPTPNSWGQLYGRYTVRFRSDFLPGYKIAFLLWPDDNNWADGEIDFPEVGSLKPGGTIYANLFPPDRPVLSEGQKQIHTAVDAAGTGWHTATIEWLPSGVTYILDGVNLGTSTPAPSVPMHWALQVETSLGAPVPSASVAGHLQVDWIAMYTRTQ